MDLCERSTRKPGARVSPRWWDQSVTDLDRAKKRAAAAEAETDSYSDSDSVKEDSIGASRSSGAEWSVVEWSEAEGWMSVD